MSRKKIPEKFWIFSTAVLSLALVVLFFSTRPARRPAAPVGKKAPVVVKRPAPPRRAAPPPAFPRGRGKIAIVLDDWGYNLQNVPALSSIRRPVTVAVLPNLPHSADISKEARAHGHEVILHMPMEAMNEEAPREKGTLLTTMPRQQVIQLLGQALSSVPGSRGISNHQGSSATSDLQLMEMVMGEMKRRGLYFLDSFVTNRSVCGAVAQRMKVPFAQRAVFLDNIETEPAIRTQLTALALAAKDNGEAIGIGHDRPRTLEVLEKAVPEMEKAGYTFVAVSDLVS